MLAVRAVTTVSYTGDVAWAVLPDATSPRVELGLRHTGYMKFHEPTMSKRSGPRPAPPPPEFPCPQCGRIFRTTDDLAGAVHLFDAHVTERLVRLGVA